MFSILLKHLRSHGLVSTLRLGHIIYKGKLRDAWNAHLSEILLVFYASCVLIGIGGLVELLIAQWPTSGWGLGWRIVLGSLASGVAFFGASWFLMPQVHRAMLLGEVLAACLFGLLSAVLAGFLWNHLANLWKTDPQQALGLGAAALVVAITFAHPVSLLLRHLFTRARLTHYAFETPYQQQMRVRLVMGDLRSAAIHEAGHALLYAVGNRIPDDALAYVDRETLSPVLGAVGFPHVSGMEPTVEFTHWQLHTLLAGMVAEQVVLGRKGFGAGGDLELWGQMSEAYLSLRDDVAYYLKPQTDLEQEANKRELVRLKRRIIVSLTRYMTANKHVLLKIADRLLEVDCLDYNDLADLLRGAVKAGGVPSVFWPANAGGVEFELMHAQVPS
ncbi:metalloprotease [Ralstonia pseudosolanacearum]|uniref:metalloprotease n=1 Tax=Ralstonia pseudosolanacearum TaxID=1310165 RepID=UPI003CF6D51F